MLDTRKQKSPSIVKKIEGLHPVYLTLLCWNPITPSYRGDAAIFLGRSSDFPAFLAAFPFRSVETVANIC